MILLTAGACSAPSDPAPDSAPGATFRIALFNIRELESGKLEGGDPQVAAAAAIVRRVRPDVLVLNEIDHDYRTPEAAADLTLNARRFAERYLAADDGVGEPLVYPHAFAAPNNTGFLTGLDLNGDGHVATEADRGERRYGDDCFGWGTYPGQYSMAVLSRLPLAAERARTFQHFLWRDLPGHHLPPEHYSAEALAILRLSSKSHWDLPLRLPASGGRDLHLLISHPTPPVFDGEEDRNGRRNFDEIKLWAHYLDGSPAIRDDAGRAGGLEQGASFVIVGDLNARPGEEVSRYDGQAAIDQLLGHPRVQDSGPWLISEGALEAAAAAALAAAEAGSEGSRDAAPPAAGPPGHPERATAAFGGGRRIDYVLPSTDLEIVDGGVFWPSAEGDPEGAALAEEASDHRLLWLDLRLPAGHSR